MKKKNLLLLTIISSNYYLTFKLFEMMELQIINYIFKYSYYMLYTIVFLWVVKDNFSQNERKFPKIQIYTRNLSLLISTLIIAKFILSYIFINKSNQILEINNTVKLAMNFGFIYIILSMNLDKKDTLHLFLAFLISSSFSTLVSIYKYPDLINSRDILIYGKYLFRGGFWNTSVISFVTTACISLFYLKDNINVKYKFIILSLAIVSTIGSLYSLSRSFFIIFMFIIIMYMFLMESEKKKISRNFFLLFSFLVILRIVFPTSFEIIYKRFRNIGGISNFLGMSRFNIWFNYIKSFYKYFLLGVWSKDTYNSIAFGQGAHSFILNFITLYGIIPTVLLINIVKNILKNFKRSQNHYETLYIHVFVILIFVSINDTGLYDTGFYISIGIMTVLIFGLIKNEPNKNIYLQAYMDRNIGDDIMIQGLLSRYPETDFYITNRIDIIKSDYSGFPNLHFTNKRNLCGKFKTMDGFLTIGGSVFQFHNNMDVKRRLKKIIMLSYFKFKGASVATIGSNMGPFKTKTSLIIAKLELILNDFVTVRDEYSYNFVKNIVPNRVEFSEDIVFELITPRFNHDNKNNVMGITAYRSIISPELNIKTTDSLVSIIEDYLRNDSNKVKLFAFNTLNEDDLKLATRIKSHFDTNRVEIVPYKGKVNSFLETYSECSKIIAIRFHGAILSEIFNIPFLPIAYSNKMTNYINDKYNVKPILLENLDHIKLLNEELFITPKISDSSSFVHLKTLDKFIMGEG